MFQIDDSGRRIEYVSTNEQIARILTDYEKRLSHLERLEDPAGGTCGAWNPLCPPATADVDDDEFDTGALAAAWTAWDPGATGQVVAVDDVLEIVQPTSAGDSFSGIFKNVPTSPYTIWSKIGHFGVPTNHVYTSIILGQDLTNNPATSDFYSAFVRTPAAGKVEIGLYRWSQWNTFSAVIAGPVDVDYAPEWFFRLRISGTSLGADVGITGLGWYRIANVTMSFTPAEMGYALSNGNSGVDLQLTSPFFRVISGNDFYQVMEGARG